MHQAPLFESISAQNSQQAAQHKLKVLQQKFIASVHNISRN